MIRQILGPLVKLFKKIIRPPPPGNTQSQQDSQSPPPLPGNTQSQQDSQSSTSNIQAQEDTVH